MGRWLPSMKALLVTSRVTFVPDNYDGLVLAMADSPQVGGLLVLDNARGVRLTALGALAMGARRLGGQLWRNSFWRRSEQRRRDRYQQRGKGFWVRPSVNDQQVLDLVRTERFDLIVNARTRCIFRQAILAAPPLGCLNLHHGLLPDQRGVMCDLWAIHEGQPAGFSVHRMTSKIDDGEVLRAVPVGGEDRDYLRHLARSAAREAQVLTDLLAEMAATMTAGGGGSAAGFANRVGPATVYRKNPGWKDVRRMRAGGLRL
jgi:methionyl-tRNA formyltransferase